MRFVLAAIAALALAQPARAVDDPFAGQPRASLHVRIELAGANRVNFPNGVEWARIEALRTLEVDFGLVDIGIDAYAIVSTDGKNQPGTTPAVEDLQAKIAACGENQKCLADAMMAFAQSAESSADAFAQMTGAQPGRYRNFAADHHGTCAKGTLVVEDVLSGVVIPPPNPAVAYRFTRNGALTLPVEDEYLMDYACRIELTLDTATGAMSLRLPAAKLQVPVTMGPTAFTHERSTPLVEGPQTIELIDQPTGGTWTGIAEVETGSASHNSGQVAAPLKGRVTWSFSEG